MRRHRPWSTTESEAVLECPFGDPQSDTRSRFGLGCEQTGETRKLEPARFTVVPVRVLVVEDDEKLADLIRRALLREGWSVDLVSDGRDAVWHGVEFDYDVIVLDLGLPHLDGLEVCRELRASERWAPVLMLTARDGIPDRVAGLDAGADDYLTKPFSFEELAARLRSLARRAVGPRPTRLVVGELELDPASKRVRRSGAEIKLSSKEFSLLEYLMRNAGAVVSRSELLDHVWAGDYGGTSNVVDVYVRMVRQKVDAPAATGLIETVRGSGYRVVTGDIERL